jgi:hypothetical protein
MKEHEDKECLLLCHSRIADPYNDAILLLFIMPIVTRVGGLFFDPRAIRPSAVDCRSLVNCDVWAPLEPGSIESYLLLSAVDSLVIPLLRSLLPNTASIV